MTTEANKKDVATLLAAALITEVKVRAEEPTEIVKYADIELAVMQPTSNALLGIIAAELRELRCCAEQVWIRVEEAIKANAEDEGDEEDKPS